MTASGLQRVPAIVGEPVPAVCLVKDVCRHLRMSRATFDRLMSRNALAVAEMPRLGGMRRFTGQSVQALKRSQFAQGGR